MKRILLFCLALCALAPLSAQQGPYYLSFNLACMDQLEYRASYSGTSSLSFLFRPTANDYFVLTGGSGGITAPTLPKGTKDCRDVVFDDALIQSVNNLSKQMYVVQQTQSGYILTPVISITQITRSGTYYIFRSNNYSFALDTTRLIYGANLASVGSPSAVYFTGLKDIYACRFQYSFRREPSRPGMEKSDFDFIPGAGIVSDKPGLTATEAETNQTRLWSINGRPLEEYLAALCGRQPGSSTSGSPQYPVYTGGNPAVDKEEASAIYGGGYGNAGTGAGSGLGSGISTNPQTGMGGGRFANCPEPFGNGYHIVQPGESLLAIARTYNVRAEDLIKWNKIKNADKIEVCQKIWLQKPPANTTPKTVTTGKGASQADQSGRTVVNQSPYWGNAANVGSGPTPVAHNTPGPTGALTPVSTADYWGQIAGSSKAVLIHVVQKGETLSGLARNYGYTDERFRRMNGFPAVGDYRLAEGQQVVVSDCEYDTNSPTPTQIISTPPGTGATIQTNPNTTQKVIKMTGSTPSATVPITHSNTPWNTPSATPSTIYSNPAPAASGTVPSNQFLENSVLDTGKEGSYTPPGATRSVVQPNTYSNPSTQTATPVSSAPLQEYTVKQGDTLRSIAIRYKVNEQELATTNGLDPNESLIPGKRLLIPRQ